MSMHSDDTMTIILQLTSILGSTQMWSPTQEECVEMIILKGRSSSVILVHLNHGNENTIHFQSQYLSITFNNMRRRSWIYRRRRRGMMWKIVLSHTWFKCQCILMIPSLSFCNTHQYWNWLRHEDSLSKAVLIWLFWKGGHLVSSW